MAGLNSPNHLKNINFSPNKNVAKTTAVALTLLLSTVACNVDKINAFLNENICWVAPLSCFAGAYVVLGIVSLFGRGDGGGGGGSFPPPPTH